MIVVKEFVSLTVVAMEAYQLSYQLLLRRKMFHQKYESYIYLPRKKIELIGEALGEKNGATSNIYVESQMYVCKAKKYFLHFMTTFHNFALKIETS